jgi:hypothetical protein
MSLRNAYHRRANKKDYSGGKMLTPEELRLTDDEILEFVDNRKVYADQRNIADAATNKVLLKLAVPDKEMVEMIAKLIHSYHWAIVVKQWKGEKIIGELLPEKLNAMLDDIANQILSQASAVYEARLAREREKLIGDLESFENWKKTCGG